MSRQPGERHAEVLEAAVTPTRSEVMRAKQLILERLSTESRSVMVTDLVQVLNEADGIGPAESNERLSIPWPAEDWQPDRTNPTVARIRNQAAGRQAIDELARRGAINPVHNRDTTIPIQDRNTSGGYRYLVDEPVLAPGYVVPAAGEQLGVVDVDLFTADLGSLGLDPRTRRCLEEALTAHRQGLYLSAASLLGAVSEGAWYVAGEQLRGQNAGLGRALDDDRTAQVIDRVCELMRQVGRLRATANELHAHAAHLRDLRNYGVHPRQEIDTAQEPAFTEAATMALILQTHRYLVRLAASVDAMVTEVPDDGRDND